MSFLSGFFIISFLSFERKKGKFISLSHISQQLCIYFSDIKVGKKNYIREKVLEFCEGTKDNDDINNINIQISMTVEGKEVKLTNRLNKLIAKFEKKSQRRIEKR